MITEIILPAASNRLNKKNERKEESILSLKE
jgi:hypothetical protein